jgi:hypothetical protein
VKNSISTKKVSRAPIVTQHNNFPLKKIERTCALFCVIMPNRLQSEIDNVKKFQTVVGSLTSVLLLLTLSAGSTLATTWNEPILAQSAPTDPNAPTDTPIPVRSDDRNNNNNLWWLLTLIPIGGLVWASSRSRRQDPASDVITIPSPVPNVPVSSIDPLLLNGRAPQRDLVDANSPVESDLQRANGLADLDPVTFQSANSAVPPARDSGRRGEPLVTTPSVAVPIDDRSTQSAVVVEELTIRHETSKMPLTSVPEPDRHPSDRIRLLEERLVVDRHKRKAGEVRP